MRAFSFAVQKLTKKRFFTVGALLLIGAQTPATAGLLTMHDPSFELNELMPYRTTTGTNAWYQDYDHANAAGSWFAVAGAFDDPVPDGSYIAWINNNYSVWQGLTVTLSAGTYTFSAWIGERKDLSGAGWSPSVVQFNLLAGDTVLTADIFSNNVPGVGQWAQSEKIYTIAADDPNIGKQLVVKFTNPNNGNCEATFDNISLDFQAIPEPATALLFGIGGMGAWILRRKKVRSEDETDM